MFVCLDVRHILLKNAQLYYLTENEKTCHVSQELNKAVIFYLCTGYMKTNAPHISVVKSQATVNIDMDYL